MMPVTCSRTVLGVQVLQQQAEGMCGRGTGMPAASWTWVLLAAAAANAVLTRSSGWAPAHTAEQLVSVCDHVVWLALCRI